MPPCGLGMALDYRKAFDSVNCTIGLHLMERAGIPEPVLHLSSQCQNQTRWLSLGGAIHSELLQAELGPHSHAAAALKGMPNEHSVKKHVEVLGYYLGDKAHDHPNCRYLGLSRPDWPTVLSVVLRAGAKKPPTRGHLLLPAPFKFLFFGGRDTAKQQCRSSPHIRQILQPGHGSDLAFIVVSRLLNALARWCEFRN